MNSDWEEINTSDNSSDWEEVSTSNTTMPSLEPQVTANENVSVSDAAKYLGLNVADTGAKATDLLLTLLDLGKPSTRAQDFVRSYIGAPEDAGVYVPPLNIEAPTGDTKTISGNLSNLFTGVKNTPAVLFETARAVPQGLSNLTQLPSELGSASKDAANLAISELFGTPFQPAGTDYDKIKNTLSGIGKTASMIAMAPLNPVVGPAVGDTLFDTALEATGSKEKTSASEKLAKTESGIGTFGTVKYGADLLRGLKTGGSKLLDKEASQFDRKGLQTRQSDYGSKSDTRTIETPERGIETFTKNKLDSLLEEGALGKSRNPQKLTKVVNEKLKTLGNEVDTIISSYDKKIADGAAPPAVPDFTGARAYIQSGKVPADLIESYLERLNKIESNIVENGGGKLDYLQKQKTAFGKSWNPADAIKSNFDRQIYTDLKKSIESYAPEVKPINQELSKYLTVEPIVNRSLKASENSSLANKLRDIMWTTGGVGAPTLVGSMLGGPAGAATGAAVGVASRMLASPTGQAMIARGLRNVSGGLKAIPEVPNLAGIPLKLGTQNAQTNNNSYSDLFSKKKVNEPTKETAQTRDVGKSNISAVESVIDQDPYLSTLYEVESGRNPLAKNPTSSAKGAFQFIDSTAKAVGLDDPYDLEKSFVAIKRLTDENRARFGDDPTLLYSAHYLGATVLNKVLKGLPLKPKEQAQVDYLRSKVLPKFNKIYRSKIGQVEA